MASRRKQPTVSDALKERRVSRKTDELKKWEARIQYAEQECEERYKVYDENERAYYGRIMPNSHESVTLRNTAFLKSYEIEINKLLPVLASQRERILPRIPWSRLNPQKPQNRIEQAQMRAAEMSLNFLLRAPRMGYHQSASLLLLGASLGIGALEVCNATDEGVDPEKDKEEATGEFTVEIDDETNMEVLEIEGGDPLMTEDGDFVRRGRKIVLDLRDPLDYFDIRYVHWQDLRFDPEGGNKPEELDWLATKFSLRLDEALANPIFATADKEEMKRAARSVIAKRPRDIIRPPRPYEDQRLHSSGKDDDFLRVTGWRCWHASKRQVVYIVDGMADVASKYEYPGWIGHSPISFLKFYEKFGTFLPQTEVEFALPSLRSYSLFMQTLLNHLKRFKRKYGATPNAFEKPEERDSFLDPIDGSVITVRSEKDLWAIEDAYLDPAIYQMMERSKMDFFEIMGSAPEFVGAAQSTSATQSAIIDRRGVGREEEKREMLARTMEDVSDKMLANLQHNLPRELAVRIVGPDGRHWKKVVNRPDIQGRFKSWIDLTELEPHNQAQETQKMLGFLQIMGPEVAFTSEAFTRQFFKNMAWNDPNIQQDFVQLATLLFAQRLFGGGGEKKPATGGETKGGAKPTGQGPEEGATTEGRSQGRTQREFNTLLGPGSTPREKSA